jgi:hypothetical protein
MSMSAMAQQIVGLMEIFPEASEPLANGYLQR